MISCYQESLSLTGKTRAARNIKLILCADTIEVVSIYIFGFGHFFKDIFSVKRSRIFLNHLSRELEKEKQVFRKTRKVQGKNPHFY